jgi:hypothetical protein
MAARSGQLLCVVKAIDVVAGALAEKSGPRTDAGPPTRLLP